MHYPLEPFSAFEENLLLWMGRFVRWKINTLSNHQVRDKEAILQCLQILNQLPQSIQHLLQICKNARKAGLIGINIFITPLGKLYEYLCALRLMSLREINEEIIIDFLSVHTSTLSDASKKNYRIVLIGFFGFIDKRNEDNGTSHVFGIELAIKHLLAQNNGQKLPAYLEERELERFLEAIDSTPLPFSHATRDKLIIKIIVYTGVRVNEILNLRTKDLIPQEDLWMFAVRGKGNKMRMVMVKKEKIENLMNAWMEQRSQIALNTAIEDSLIFCNKKGGKLTQARVYQVLGAILAQAGIKKEKMGAHMLRHTFATMLYTKKHDLVLVQEALGHANLNTSRIYTHFDKQRLIEAASVMDDFEK
ncbi:tyrosine-type recombinase/integrase [Helicobacter himalayensis]|uniref:tyrosine-type recombinase/integrase n=1 Tax=Helicobacter himalayensis TaxID=1591088 RepID=UPI0008354602|nr:tyrosine-type recombinase/integrase [Helicobacter himalayensis]